MDPIEDGASRVRSYKAAISLSNTGVTLLKRQFFNEAVATMRDALRLVREALQDNCPMSLGSNTEAKIDQFLHEASKSLAESMEVIATSLNQSLSVHVISDEFDKDMAHRAVNAAHGEEIIAIRFENNREWDMNTFHHDAAVILLNYGTACRCLARVSQSPSTPLLSAYRFFQMAYRVLSRTPTGAEIQCVDDVEAIRLHLLSMLVVRNLMTLSMQLSFCLGRLQLTVWSREDFHTVHEVYVDSISILTR